MNRPPVIPTTQNRQPEAMPSIWTSSTKSCFDTLPLPVGSSCVKITSAPCFWKTAGGFSGLEGLLELGLRDAARAAGVDRIEQIRHLLLWRSPELAPETA